MKIKDALYNMDLALNLAEDAFHKDEVPVGAVIVSEQGEILAQRYNLKETNYDACAHAEVLAIQKASSELKSWRLNNCSIFVTLEPCPMCLSAILQARIKNLYFGAYDRKGGSLSLGYNFNKDERLNHKINVFGGLRHIECSRILSRFFKQKRQKHLK